MWLLMLALGCGNGPAMEQVHDTDDTDQIQDTDTSGETGDTWDTAGSSRATYSHDCSGTETYYFTWPVQVQFGESPEMALWMVYDPAYQAYADANTPGGFPIRTAVGKTLTVDENGFVVGACSYVGGASASGYLYSSFTLVVQ